MRSGAGLHLARRGQMPAVAGVADARGGRSLVRLSPLRG